MTDKETAIKRRKRAPKNKDYVNGPELLKAINDWYDSGTETPPDKIFIAILQIVERLSTARNYVGYTYRDEMIGNGVEKCVRAILLKKFDNTKSENPFAYFSQIANNEFIRVIKNEKKETYIKHKELENTMVDASLRGETLSLPDDDKSGRIEALTEKFKKKDKEDAT